MNDQVVDTKVEGQEIEGQEQQQELQTPTYTPDEQRAMDDGWVPKDQWKGNPDEWRPAKEFNDRGELFARIKAQSAELAELKKATSFLQSQNQKQYVNGFQNAIKELQARRDAALAAEDHVAAARINDTLQDVKEQAKAAVTQVQTNTVPEPSPTYKAWAARNEWYTTDRKLQKYADAIGFEFRDTNPGATEEDMLTHVAKEIRKDFPHKVGGVRGAPSPDGSGSGGSGASHANDGASKISAIEKSMSEEQRTIMRTILKTTPKLTKEMYLKQYAGTE